MSRSTDLFLLHEMQEDDDHDIIADMLDGTDDILDDMCEHASAQEIRDEIFPLESRFRDRFDPDLALIMESEKEDHLYTCKCGALTGMDHEGEECIECKTKVEYRGGKD